jgi:membrane-associated phospholipid phosphatase
LVFLAVQLSLSVFSRGDYLFSEVARTGSGDFPSDVANMADALFLPYWFWGATCGAFSVAVLVVGLWAFLRSARSAHVEPHVDAARP